MDKLPSWKPVVNAEKVDAIMASNPELLMRETRGQIISNTRYMYDHELISRFRDRKRHIFQYPPDFLYLAIDPNAGGKPSDYAIMTIACENEQNVVSTFFNILIYTIFLLFPLHNQLILIIVYFHHIDIFYHHQFLHQIHDNS